MDRKVHKILGSLSIVFAVLFAACEKDDTTGSNGGNGTAPPNATPGERNVYVVCEGSLGNGNSSLYIQNLDGYTTYENVYSTINGDLLGDVFQSMQKIGDRLFLCVNNSDKIVVLDASTRKKVGEISVPKPRNILPIHNNKAYVSTLFSNKVYIIDPENMRVNGMIEMPAQNPEGMMLLGNKAYVTCWDTANNKVHTVDITTDQVADAYELAGYAPHAVMRDADNAIWVVGGNPQQGKQATFTCLAPHSDIVLKSMQFNNLEDPVKPILNKAKTDIYYIGVDYNGTGYNGVFRMNVNSSIPPSEPLIPAQNLQYFWALGIDPVTDEIYVGDPKGFTQKGSVRVYDHRGDLKRTFTVGVGPGNFFFDEL